MNVVLSAEPANRMKEAVESYFSSLSGSFASYLKHSHEKAMEKDISDILAHAGHLTLENGYRILLYATPEYDSLSLRFCARPEDGAPAELRTSQNGPFWIFQMPEDALPVLSAVEGDGTPEAFLEAAALSDCMEDCRLNIKTEFVSEDPFSKDLDWEIYTRLADYAPILTGGQYGSGEQYELRYVTLTAEPERSGIPGTVYAVRLCVRAFTNRFEVLEYTRFFGNRLEMTGNYVPVRSSELLLGKKMILE